MDDAREWIAAGPGAGARGTEVVQPGDPWGAPLARDDAVAPVLGRPASVWRRSVALGLDLAVLGLFRLVGDALTAAMGGLAPLSPVLAQAFAISWSLVVPAAYFVLSHGTGGQTLGKRILGIRVVGAGGEPVGYLHALGRLIATIAAALPAGLGFVLAATRRDRRGAHDLLAGTRVVRAP